MIEVYEQYVGGPTLDDPRPVAIDLRHVTAVCKCRHDGSEHYDFLTVFCGNHFHQIVHDFDNFLVDWRAWRKP